MIKTVDKNKCCGCYACNNICPKGCISMKENYEGFWYPVVSEEFCIKCGLCKSVCPAINDVKKDYKDKKYYACKNKNVNTRIKSSSGGVFQALCNEVIKNNGVVFGAAFNENFEVEHKYADNLMQCESFRGSKYVQSKIGETYKQAKVFLEKGRVVLFSGTQCQIKGLNLFLRKKYKNLVTVDVVCHGVPSPLVFKKYIIKNETNFKSKISKVEFRDKTFGWKDFSLALKLKNGGKYINKFSENIYMKGFLSNLYLRTSCYKCTAKNFKSGSDISLADYWGVNKMYREFDDNKGVSLVLINTKIGSDIFKKVYSELEVIETELKYAIENNPCIVKPSEYNNKRKKFFKDLNEKDIELAIEAGLKIKFCEKIRNKILYEIEKIRR